MFTEVWTGWEGPGPKSPLALRESVLALWNTHRDMCATLFSPPGCVNMLPMAMFVTVLSVFSVQSISCTCEE